MASASKFFWHVLRLPVEFFTQRSAGEIGSRVAINDKVARMLSGDLAQAVLSVLKALFFGLLMFWYDAMLTSISIAIVAAQFVFLRLVTRQDEGIEHQACDRARENAWRLDQRSPRHGNVEGERLGI
jgi:ABC-type bacteriocin/lantibiotic exporter with double-glycine peptidase domain